ncbi:hypothetical protein JQ612_14280 [Bradyrhizobium manausense]|nr:hypothetical protein [Bradyrhizobium manausense]MBR0834356.1 hypothetical protein [Bradyrhizobium manausense]
MPLTIPHLAEQAKEIWRLVGAGALALACGMSREIDGQLRALTQSGATQQ